MKIMEPVPPFDGSFDMTLEQVIRDRCLSLLARHRRLHLLWSGGIDTTAMVVGFLQVATREDWTSRLSVHYCRRSVRENPRFFERHIRPLPQHSAIEGHVRDFVDGRRVVVTGDPADMLLGTVFMAKAFDGSAATNPMYFALDKPWRFIVPQMLRERGLLRPGFCAEQEWVQWMETQVCKAPIAVETLFDWLWWITYSCKFQHDLMRVYYNREAISSSLHETVENFYLSAEWHQWSFHNHDKKMLDKTVWASYKWPLKQYIFNYDGDCEYFAGKVKVKSTL